jgi:hypothetical protein
MVCYFSCVGQVVSVSSGAGIRVADVLMSEGPIGGSGEDRSFQIHFWPGSGTDLLPNKCYLLRGTVVLQDERESEVPRVNSSTVSLRPIFQLTTCYSYSWVPAFDSLLRTIAFLPHLLR